MPAEPIGIFVQVSDVFPGIGNDLEMFRVLLRQISRTDGVFWCARLNLALSGATDEDFHSGQQYALDVFLDTPAIERVNEFIKERQSKRVVIFFRGQLLELMRWICLLSEDKPGDG